MGGNLFVVIHLPSLPKPPLPRLRLFARSQDVLRGHGGLGAARQTKGRTSHRRTDTEEGQSQEGSRREANRSVEHKGPVVGFGYRAFLLCTEAEHRLHIRNLNLNRRHLTREQRRELIAAQLRETPDKPNLQIAKAFQVDDHTVETIRQDMVRRSEIPNTETRTDTKGRKQPAKKRSGKKQNSKKPGKAASQAASQTQPADLPIKPIPRPITVTISSMTVRPGGRREPSGPFLRLPERGRREEPQRQVGAIAWLIVPLVLEDEAVGHVLKLAHDVAAALARVEGELPGLAAIRPLQRDGDMMLLHRHLALALTR